MRSGPAGVSDWSRTLLSEHVAHELAAELVRLVLITLEDIADPSETRLSEPVNGDREEGTAEAGEAAGASGSSAIVRTPCLYTT